MDRFVAHDASGLVILRSWDPGITDPWIARKTDYDHDPASSLISLPATYQRRDLRPWIFKITSSVSSFRSITTSIGLCLQFKAASFHVRPSLQTWLVRKILANPRQSSPEDYLRGEAGLGASSPRLVDFIMCNV